MKRNSNLVYGWMALCCSFVWLTGCQNQTESGQQETRSQNNEVEPGDPFAGMTGELILQKSVTQYATADSYRDDGMLYLSYQLEGKPIQEPHPFSTVWVDSNKLSSRIFNSKIQCNGNLLSCYIYDIDSGNLDNQQLVLDSANEIPVDGLYKDSIARHFLGGYSELPMDESRKQSVPKLVPAPISLLVRNTIDGWLQSPAKAQRLTDVTFDGLECFVVRSLHDGTTADIWIDKKEFVVRKISYPLKIMARKVLTSGEIKDVELVAIFHNAQLNASVDDKSFAVSRVPDAKVVRQFTSIPEPFPSELIGEKLPAYQFYRGMGEVITQRSFSNKTGAFLFLGGEDSIEFGKNLGRLIETELNEGIECSAVYSDAELANPADGSIQPIASVAEAFADTQIELLYDQQQQVIAGWKLQILPAIVIVDKEGRLQFAKPITGESSGQEIVETLKRIERGDDVAAEMKGEYQRFLERYHQQIAQFNANAWIEGGDTNSGSSPNASDPSNRMTGSMPNTNGREVPTEFAFERVWVNSNLSQPGNILTTDDLAELAILDGWRSVVFLNSDGSVVRRIELELPQNEAVGCLRSVVDESGNRLWAFFSVRGKRIYLFDQEFQKLPITDTFPKDDAILDAQFTKRPDDRSVNLVISYLNQDVKRIDLRSQKSAPVKGIRATSLAASADGFRFCSQEVVGEWTWENGLRETKIDSSKGHGAWQRVLGGLDEVALVAASQSNAENWQLVKFDSELNENWATEIGPQLFESELEPNSFGGSSSNRFVAIATSNDEVQFLSLEGKYMGRLDIGQPITGLSCYSNNGATKILVSSGKTVQCFQLRDPTFVRPVSIIK